MKEKILVVDDEKMLTQLLYDHLTREGYLVYTAGSATEALEHLKIRPDLILLDINMPGMDGLELCSLIRDSISCPVLFLTARITEEDKVKGLLTGGDDYITKPFGLKELTARIGAHLRREERRGRTGSVIAFGKLLVYPKERMVVYGEKNLSFSRREFDILKLLVTNPGQVFDKERIYELLWGCEAEGDSQVVKEHIRKIRGKLLDVTGQEYIETVWGVGYRWQKETK